MCIVSSCLTTTTEGPRVPLPPLGFLSLQAAAAAAGGHLHRRPSRPPPLPHSPPRPRVTLPSGATGVLPPAPTPVPSPVLSPCHRRQAPPGFARAVVGSGRTFFTRARWCRLGRLTAVVALGLQRFGYCSGTLLRAGPVGRSTATPPLGGRTMVDVVLVWLATPSPDLGPRTPSGF